MIIMVRADDRLIHGMVAVSWTSHLQPQTILVANNVAAKDSFKAMTMKMAKPAGVNLVIKSLDDSVKALNNPINDKKKIFLVTETVKDAAYIYERTAGFGHDTGAGYSNFSSGSGRSNRCLHSEYCFCTSCRCMCGER